MAPPQTQASKGPGIGAFVAPQPSVPVQGVAPTTPEAHQELSGRWLQYFKNPAIQAGLFQLGTSMLSSIGTGQNFVRRLGLSLNDAGQAAGRTTAFMADQANKEVQLDQGQQRIGLEGQRVSQEATNAANQKDYQGKSLNLQGKQLDATTAQNQAELALKTTDLGETASYHKALVALQGEQLKVSQAGMQTPRGRALIQLLKSATEQASLDDTFDQETYITHGMDAIDKMFPEAGPALPGAAPAVPAPGAGADAAPAAPASGALPPPPPPAAVTKLQADPSPANKAYFDQIFGPGAADKALAPATAAPAPAAPGVDPNKPWWAK